VFKDFGYFYFDILSLVITHLNPKYLPIKNTYQVRENASNTYQVNSKSKKNTKKPNPKLF
jgi:hypothetical protein